MKKRKPTAQEIKDYKKKYDKCIDVIRRFDTGIIGMYDL